MPTTTCYSCGGKGKHLKLTTEPCTNCFGTGKDLHSESWTEQCPKCSGEGKIPAYKYVVCEQCHGSGLKIY